MWFGECYSEELHRNYFIPSPLHPSQMWLCWLSLSYRTPENGLACVSILAYLVYWRWNLGEVCWDSLRGKNRLYDYKKVVVGGPRVDCGLSSVHFREQHYTNPSIYLQKSEFSTKGTSFRDSRRNQAHYIVGLGCYKTLFFFIKNTQKEALKVVFQRKGWQKSQAGLGKTKFS